MTSHAFTINCGRTGALLAAATLLGLSAATSPLLAQQVAAAPIDGTIVACYVPRSGTMYRIRTGDTREKCASKEHIQFSFSTSGAAGAPGPVGPAGPIGLAGPVGPQGPAAPIAGLEVVQVLVPLVASSSARAKAECPAGKIVTGGGAKLGGFRTIGGVAQQVVFSQGPDYGSNGSSVPDAWEANASATADAGSPTVLIAYAICATRAP